MLWCLFVVVVAAGVLIQKEKQSTKTAWVHSCIKVHKTTTTLAKTKIKKLKNLRKIIINKRKIIIKTTKQNTCIQSY